MREIKFRAWSKKYKWLMPMSDWLSDGKSFLDEDLIVMQYTGLKDKNGKEIYEGDILRYAENGEIAWDNQGYFGVTNFGIGNCHPLHLTSQEDREIIGNIYDNPELLKTNQN